MEMWNRGRVSARTSTGVQLVACLGLVASLAAGCSSDGDAGDHDNGDGAASSLGDLEPWVRTVPERATSLSIADMAGIEEAIGTSLDFDDSQELLRILQFHIGGGLLWEYSGTRGVEAREIGLGLDRIGVEIAATTGDFRGRSTSSVVLGADIGQLDDALDDARYDTEVDGDRTIYTPDDDTDSPFGSLVGTVGIDTETGAVVLGTGDPDVRVDVPAILAQDDAAPSVLDDDETADLLTAVGPLHFLTTMPSLRDDYERYPVPSLLGFSTLFAEDATATETLGIVYRDEADATDAADLLRDDVESDERVAEQMGDATIEVVGRVLLVRLAGLEQSVFARSLVTLDLIPPLFES